MMLGCEVLFGADRGAEVRAMYEKATEAVCPCSRGLKCPLFPAEKAPDLVKLGLGLGPAA